MNTFLFIIFSLFHLISFSSWADWAPENSAPVQVEDSKSVVEIDKDGNAIEIGDYELKALNENGRNQLVLRTIPYIPDATKVEVLKASSVTQGIEENVDLRKIQDRSASAPSGGISHARELVIPFSNLQIGSKVKYTVKMTSLKKLVRGFHESHFSFGINGPEIKGSARIRSEIPLYVQMSDPWNILETKSYVDEKKYYIFEFQQKKPLFKSALDIHPIYRIAQVSRLSVSTMKDWASYAKPIIERYEEVLSSRKLPDNFIKIAEKAKKVPLLEDKIDIVTSELARVMTYSGNWTSFNKMYFPSDLNTISKLNTGDCKDFSLATTAILRHLGIKAQVAFTLRKVSTSVGVVQLAPINLEYPSQTLFNHAIVKVIQNEKVLWVDPTNIVSDSGFIFSDIAGSYALALNPASPSLEKIPFPSSSRSFLSYDKTVRIQEDNSGEAETNFQLSGEFSKAVLEASHYKGEEAGQENLQIILGTPKSAKSFYEKTDLKSRISKKLNGKMKEMGGSWAFEKDGKRYAYVAIPLSPLSLLASGSRRVTDFGVPTTASESIKIKYIGVDFVGFPLECTTYTPWFQVKRSFFKTKDGFEMQQVSTLNRNEIAATEVNSDKFQMFLGDLNDCLQDSRVEIRTLRSGETLEERLKEYTLNEAQNNFDKTGAESVRGAQISYHIVEQLLQKSPEDKELLVLKARALRRVAYKNEATDRTEYLDLADQIIDHLSEKYPTDSLVWQQKVWSAYFRKNIPLMSQQFAKLYSFSEKNFALYNLGASLAEMTKNSSAARAAYLKALSVATKDKERASASSGIAELAFDQNNIDEAIKYYQQALQYDPSNSWAQGNLIRILTAYQRWDEAVQLGEALVKKSPYGVALRYLAESYTGKAKALYAQAIKEDPAQQSPAFKEKFQAVEVNLLKGLKHHGSCGECLEMLGRIYLDRGNLSKNSEDLQRSLSYYEKARINGKQNGKDYLEKVINDIKTTIAKNKSQPLSGERFPAQASP